MTQQPHDTPDATEPINTLATGLRHIPAAAALGDGAFKSLLRTTTLVLELAAQTGNPELVADLVETSIKNNTHTTGTNPDKAAGGDDGERVPSARARGIEATEAAASRTAEPFTNNGADDGGDGGPATTAAGTTILTTAALPCHPSPPLLTPTPSNSAPRIALQHWNSPTKECPKLPRPTTPIRTRWHTSNGSPGTSFPAHSCTSSTQAGCTPMPTATCR